MRKFFCDWTVKIKNIFSNMSTELMFLKIKGEFELFFLRVRHFWIFNKRDFKKIIFSSACAHQSWNALFWICSCNPSHFWRRLCAEQQPRRLDIFRSDYHDHLHNCSTLSTSQRVRKHRMAWCGVCCSRGSAVHHWGHLRVDLYEIWADSHNSGKASSGNGDIFLK